MIKLRYPPFLLAFLALFSSTAFAVDVIVDNTHAGETNNGVPPWVGFSTATGYLGQAGRTTVNAAWSKFQFGVGQCPTCTSVLSGEYDVYIWYPAATGIATLADTTVTVNVKPVGTAVNVVVNQRINGGTWVLLGRYALNNTAYVQINADTGGVALMDAVKLVPFVAPPPPPASTATLSASPLAVDTGADTTATWASVASPTTTDWLGLYTPGAASTAPVASTIGTPWVYANSCTRTAAGTTLATGNCPFTILQPGTYEVRLFTANTFTRLATSQQIVVTTPTSAIPALTMTGLAPTDPVELTWAGTNVDTCTAGGDWTGAKTTAGTENLGPITANSSYALSCTGSGGTVSRSVNVTVATVSSPSPPPTQTPPPPTNAPPDHVTALKLTTTPTIDGVLDEPEWDLATFAGKPVIGTPNNTMSFDVKWNDTHFFVAGIVGDQQLINDSAAPSDDDSFEIYFDPNHSHALTFDTGAMPDLQFTKGYNDATLTVTGGVTTGVTHASAACTGGYCIELSIPWTKLGITPANLLEFGFDIGVNDDDGLGADILRDHQTMWWGDAQNYVQTDLYGHVTLIGTPVGQPPTTTTTLPPPPGPQGALVYGLGVQSHISPLTTAARATVLDLAPTAIRLGAEAPVAATLDNINWADTNNMDVVYHLGYGGGCGTPTIAANRQCYANQAASRVATFGGKVKWVQVWNEWNGGMGLGCHHINNPGACWTSATPANEQSGRTSINTAMYTDLLCKTYAAVKAVAPTVLVVGPVTAGTDFNFVDRALLRGAGACTDIIDVHPYINSPIQARLTSYPSSARVAVDAFARDMGLLRARMATRGVSKPIMISEEGLQAYNAATDAQQAAYISELYRRAPSMTGVMGIWWFSRIDAADAGGNTWGIIRANGTLKPGYHAFKASTPKP